MNGQFSISSEDLNNFLAEWCRCGSVHMTIGGICFNFKRSDFGVLAEKMTKAAAHFESHSQEMSCGAKQGEMGKLLQFFKKAADRETAE